MQNKRKVLVADAVRTSAERTALMLEASGYEAVITCDGREAAALCGNESVYAVVADAILPGIDGYALAGVIRRTGLLLIPGIVVTHLPGIRRSLIMPGACLLERPFSADSLASAVASVSAEMREPSPEMLDRIDMYFRKLGIPEHRGREYLAQAVFLVHEDMSLSERLTKGLYPLVGERCGAAPAAVERAMRHVIDLAWSRGNIDSQYEIFKNTIDAARGKPTCGGMIAQLAHMLRREVF